METNWIGIDVSKDWIDVGFLAQKEVARFGQSELEAAVERVVSETPELVVLEATGGYEAPVVSALARAKVPTVVVNPRQVPDSWTKTGDPESTKGESVTPDACKADT